MHGAGSEQAATGEQSCSSRRCYWWDARWNLIAVDDGEEAGESVDLDPVFPTVGANWRGSNSAMPILEGFRSIERIVGSDELDGGR
jgi:hypothetical protein